MAELIYDDNTSTPPTAPTLTYDEEKSAPSWTDTLTNLWRSVRPSGDFEPLPGETPEQTRARWRQTNTVGAPTINVVSGIPVVGEPIAKGAAYATGLPLEQYRAEHPVATAAQQLTGGVMSTVPVARAFPTLFGGSTWTGQTLAGGALGAADAASRSNFDVNKPNYGVDPYQVGLGAAIGTAAPTVGQLLAPVGQLATSGVNAVARRTPGVRSVLAPEVAVPTGKELIDQADRGFNSLNNMMQYDPVVYGRDLPNLIKRDIYGGAAGSPGSSQIGARETHAILDTIPSLPPTPGSLHTVRKELQDVSNRLGGDEGRNARYAIKKIDDFLEAPPASTIIAPGAGNARQVLDNANADWKAGLNAIDFEKNIGKAAVSGADNPFAILAEGANTRRAARATLRNNRTERFLDPEGRAAVESVTKPGSLGEALMQAGGAVSGTRHWGPLSIIPGGLTVASYLTGGPLGWAALAGQVGGAGANIGTSFLTRQAADRASKQLRLASPTARDIVNAQMPPPISMSPPPRTLRPSLSPQQSRDEITRLIMLQAQQRAADMMNSSSSSP